MPPIYPNTTNCPSINKNTANGLDFYSMPQSKRINKKP
jgi:hypothetical protein